MRKLRRRRCLELFMVVMAMALVAAVPAAALAGEGSGGGSTVGETGTESSSGSTEVAPPASEEASPTTAPPPSAGWVPQGEGTEASSDGAASTRHGSSLGSGASPAKQAESTGEESSYSGGPSGYYEPESSAQSTVEEPASKPQAASPADSVEPQAAVEPAPREGGHAAVGVAIPVALPAPSRAADTSSGPPTASVVGVRDRVASSSGSLPLPVLVVGLLILVYAGARLLLGPVEPDLFRSGPFQRVRRAISRV
jgi:hypothetical protein